MKSKHLLVLAAVLLAGLPNMAAAETISGKISAMTKEKKVTTVEILPAAAPDGVQPAYRCSVSTDFEEIAAMLMKAMETRTSVTISSSENCKPEGLLRPCGSIITAETAVK